MTVDGKLFSETKKLFEVSDRESWWKHIIPTAEAQRRRFGIYPDAASSRQRIIVVDVPIQWLYAPGSKQQSLEMFYERMAAKCQFLLESEGTVGVLFLIDKGAPLTKAVFRKADPKTTPKTPATLAADPVEAWHEWFKTRPFVSDDDITDAENAAPKKNNYRFPDTIPVVAQRSPQYPKDEGYPYYQHCLSNVHFKRFIHRACAEAMIRLVDVPDNKWLLVSTPEYCRSKIGPTASVPGKVVTPEARLRYEFQEVDTSVGYWAMVLSDYFDVDIESNDGDSVICALLATNLRVFPGVQNVQHAKFRNRVRVVRHHWDNFPTEIIDINELFVAIHLVFENTCPQITDPIGTYALLSMLLGNDYVQGLPTVSVETVFQAFFRNHEHIGSLFLAPRENTKRVLLDWAAYQRLVVAVYGHYYPDLRLEGADVAALLRELTRTKKPAVIRTTKSRGNLLLASVRVRFANACWCLSYFHTAAYERWNVDDFETDEDDVSLWGYVRNTHEPDHFGQFHIELASDANIDLLVTNSEKWNAEV